MLEANLYKAYDPQPPSAGIFDGLDQAGFDRLSNCFHMDHYDAGSILIQEGESVQHLHIVIHGHLDVKLRMSAPSNAGPSQLRVARLGPGALIGEYGFIDSLPASATVITREKCRLLSTHHRELRTILNQDPVLASRFYTNLLSIMVARLRSDDKELTLC